MLSQSIRNNNKKKKKEKAKLRKRKRDGLFFTKTQS